MTLLKLIHISCVIISFTGFLTRSLWMFSKSVMLTKKWVKITPHVIDTLLLLSAILLVFQLQLSPLENYWLLAKLGALLLYISFGIVAFKKSLPAHIRITSGLAAIGMFLYIVSVALTKSALGFLSEIF